MKVNDYIAHETERQSGTFAEAVGMYRAWNFMQDQYSKRRVLEDQTLITCVTHINGLTEYRKVPAVFNQGMPAVPAQNVPIAMYALGRALSGLLVADYTNDQANYFTREFLEIHPFADGNGRVGSLLWNYMMDTIYDPEPMPYFFGDN